jgi:hypothetical protein
MANGRLDIGFDGYFMCRIATDPDPTNEERGMSGYTMALATEDPLDQVIRLQADPEWLRQNARQPLFDLHIQIGVKVRGVLFEGQPYEAARALLDAKVYLDGKDFPLKGPTFESRNSTVGGDDTFAFVLNPFNLRIQNDESGAKLTASDYLDPSDPAKPLWRITDPKLYQRRLPNCTSIPDTEVMEAVNVFDAYGYFRDRRRYLDKLIRDTSAARDACDEPAKRERLNAEVESYKSRIYQLDHWGDRIISKIQTRVGWQHDINGPQQAEGNFGGRIDTSQPWRVTYWFGGWDGDLLLGYMRGTLSVPFAPTQ